jgi:hypothetical protein
MFRQTQFACRMLVLHCSTNVHPASVHLPLVSLDGHIAICSVKYTSKAVLSNPWWPAINFAEQPGPAQWKEVPAPAEEVHGPHSVALLLQHTCK